MTSSRWPWRDRKHVDATKMFMCYLKSRKEFRTNWAFFFQQYGHVGTQYFYTNFARVSSNSERSI